MDPKGPRDLDLWTYEWTCGPGPLDPVYKGPVDLDLWTLDLWTWTC